jgi:hypothetical protein
MVFSGITVALLISTAMTALLIRPWANLGTVSGIVLGEKEG